MMPSKKYRKYVLYLEVDGAIYLQTRSLEKGEIQRVVDIWKKRYRRTLYKHDFSIYYKVESVASVLIQTQKEENQG